MDWFGAPDYWAARAVVQHLLAAGYLVAFCCAANQFPALLGENGLTPVPRFLSTVGFRRAPSLFHLHYSDRAFLVLAWLGVSLSALTLIGVVDFLPLWATMAVWFLLWVLYLSIVNIGQVWYSFGWESLLLEAGFLAIFLGPTHITPPAPILWLMCWLLFRVEFGAGLIKLRGDACWRDLTALYYHHETQPMPGPLSRYFHLLPKSLHKAEVLANHGTQLIIPFGLFAPQPIANIAAVIIIVTQGWLMLSGNFAWLNFVTIVLAFSAMDSAVLGWLMPDSPIPGRSPIWHQATVLVVAAAIIVLSYWPVRNMLRRRQVMNRSFNKLHLANTYGAFGSITRTRYELVIEGTAGDPDSETGWLEYGFTGKPSEPGRRPRQIAPYHLRLDWLMWFCAISPSYGRTWIPRLLQALLHDEQHILALLRHNPFPEAPPTFVRIRLFHYQFTTPEQHRETGDIWARNPVSELVPPVSTTSFSS